MRNLFYIQLFLIPVVAGIAYYLYGESPALSALYGGGIALVNSLLMIRRVVKANKALSKDPQSDVASLYVGALERFVFTLTAMAVGMGYLALNPLALLSGFGLAHLAYPFSKTVSVADN